MEKEGGEEEELILAPIRATPDMIRAGAELLNRLDPEWDGGEENVVALVYERMMDQLARDDPGSCVEQ